MFTKTISTITIFIVSGCFWFLILNRTIPIHIQCKAWGLCTFRPQSSCVVFCREGERAWLEWLRACNSVTLDSNLSRHPGGTTDVYKKTPKKTCLNNWVILLLWNDIKKLWSWNVQITNDFFSCLSAPPTSTHLRPRLYLRASSVLPYMLWFGLPRRECTRTARLIAFQLAIAEAHRVFRQSYEFIGGNAEFCWETVCIK